jgi:hypothetical protein
VLAVVLEVIVAAQGFRYLVHRARTFVHDVHAHFGLGPGASRAVIADRGYHHAIECCAGGIFYQTLHEHCL